MTVPPCGSVDTAVMPTAVPVAASVKRTLAAVLLSVGADGATLVTAIVTLAVAVLPNPSVTCTVTVWLVAVS